MRRIRNSIIAVFLLALVLLSCVACDSKKNAGFSIVFIDVGQGDSALVSCDGHYMLIDGGPAEKGAGKNVRNILEDHDVKKLDYLIISHPHDDHIGGLPDALTYISKIEKIFSNVDSSKSDKLKDFCSQLDCRGSKSVEVPNVGDIYSLGSAKFEIISHGNSQDNDNKSLVLLVTYGDTTFLFTGDMEHSTETDISNKYSDEFPITLLKVAHHGSDSGTETRFVRTTQPKYAVISVGENNQYGHPHDKVLDVLEQAGVKVYRTDRDGDIAVISDGNEILIITEK